MLRASVFVLACLAFMAHAHAFSRDLSGSYDCEGFNANGSPYQGNVEIRRKGEMYLVKWRIGRNDTYDGVGLVTGSLLSVSYYGGIEGIVVYAISEDGSRLTGRWAVRNGDGRVFEEMLVRRR